MKKMKSIKDCRLYGILDWGYLNKRDPANVVKEMIAGGVDIIQIRAKNHSQKEIVQQTKKVVPITKASGVPLIINDHPELVRETGADGIHVGQDDLSIAEVRKIIGPGILVGKSTHSKNQAIAAEKEGADYIGVGPIFSTPTKPDYQPVGLELIELVKNQIHLPFFCIGGIKLENADQVLKRGASRFVVVSGILQASNIQAYCQSLREKLA
jgi:thiamine-phosphate pyrophosphorylase